MEQKLTSEQIRQRLDELRILKNEEKNRLESLLNQKKSELQGNMTADNKEEKKEVTEQSEGIPQGGKEIKEEFTKEKKELIEILADK